MQPKKITLGRATVLVMVLGITVLFFFMVKGFLMAILLSAIFSGIMYGVYDSLKERLKGRASLASILTVLIFFMLIFLPLVGFAFLLVEQAIDAGETLVPAIQERIAHPDSFVKELEAIPLVHRIYPDEEKLLTTIKDLVDSLGFFMVSSLSHITTGAANFLFEVFIFLFAMYYFLIHGKVYINKLLYYLPLHTSEERMLLNKFIAVTKATLKGTLIIGVVQGGLGAIAMAVAGIDNTIFWGVVMAVLSIIPALGPAVVWAPAGVFLFVGGHVAEGIGLILFGAIVIGNIDNLIRPRLMGKDTQLPDLMILFSTLGGLALFGMSGIIIGPIIAALFITMLEIYAFTFKDYLEPVQLESEEEISVSRKDKKRS